jgi:hypothetical protein
MVVTVAARCTWLLRKIRDPAIRAEMKHLAAIGSGKLHNLIRRQDACPRKETDYPSHIRRWLCVLVARCLLLQ